MANPDLAQFATEPAAETSAAADPPADPAADPAAAASAPAHAVGWLRIALRAEDLLLAGWIVLAAPLLAQAGGSAGPFDTGHPVVGLLALAGFCGALTCLATRGPEPAGGTALSAGRAGVLSSGSVGPLVGGLMLVGGTAFAELGWAPEAVFGPTFLAVIVLGLLESRLPVVPTAVRRALVTPYLLTAGGLFWNIVRAVTGGLDFSQLGGALPGLSSGAAIVVGILTLGAAVYYAMLIYAPRQIAEREGGPIVWLARFGLFVVSVGFGFGWLSLLGG